MRARSSRKKVDTVNIGRAGKRAGRARSDGYHHGGLQAAVLDCADEMLEAEGIENLSLRDVASRLGVSHAAPYRHFPRKLDLLLALAERGFVELGDAMELAFREKTAKLRFESSGWHYVQLAVRHPARTALMFSRTIQCDEAPASLKEAGSRAFLGLVRIIEDGQKTGVFTDRATSQVLAMSAWSLVHGLAQLISGGQMPLDEAAVRHILAQLYQGIRKDQPRGERGKSAKIRSPGKLSKNGT